MAVLLTLPHTGTIFTRTFLRNCPGATGLHNIDNPPPDDAETRVVWGHFNPRNWVRQSQWCREERPIMTMRDPLAVAVSHHARGSDMRVDYWAKAAAVMDTFMPNYLPVDLLETEQARVEALKHTVHVAGFSTGDCIDHCRAWARDWGENRQNKTISNTVGENPAKQAYREGDFAVLQDIMPERIDAIRLHERSLRPWLERIGYRDLMWWT